MRLGFIKQVIEAGLLVSGKPLSIEQLQALFGDEAVPERGLIKSALTELMVGCEERAYEIVEVASGYRYQIKQELAPFVGRLWEEKPQRYSRALLETLALIAYRQPTTRGDIEEVRGVAVSTTIIKTLLDRNWIRVVGHKDVPGRPSLFGTTKEFLDYFNLKSLDQLPPLSEIRDLEEISREIEGQLEQGQQLLDLGDGSELTAEADESVSAASDIEFKDITDRELH